MLNRTGLLAVQAVLKNASIDKILDGKFGFEKAHSQNEI
jgi:hypothetical protein